MTPQEQTEQLKQQLQSSLLLDELDRQFWLENIETLPQPTIEKLLEILVPKNQLVDGYIDAALSQDENQEHLVALKNKIKQIKNDAFKVEENVTNKSEQKTEEDLLGQLNQA